MHRHENVEWSAPDQLAAQHGQTSLLRPATARVGGIDPGIVPDTVAKVVGDAFGLTIAPKVHLLLPSIVTTATLRKPESSDAIASPAPS